MRLWGNFTISPRRAFSDGPPPEAKKAAAPCEQGAATGLARRCFS